MKPFASVGIFLLAFFTLGVTVGAFLVPAKAAIPNVRSNLAAIPPGRLTAVSEHSHLRATLSPVQNPGFTLVHSETPAGVSRFL